MKSTISTLLPDDEQLLLNNEKETREHATIANLMRNDLSRVARNASLSATAMWSAVAIRFIERCDSRLVYKSGGGITVMSDPVEKYKKLLQKVYVPFVF